MEAEKLLSSESGNGGASNGTAVCRTNGTAGGRSMTAASSQRDGGTSSGLVVVGLKGSDYLKLLVCSGCGFVFGVAAEKARST